MGPVDALTLLKLDVVVVFKSNRKTKGNLFLIHSQNLASLEMSIFFVCVFVFVEFPCIFFILYCGSWLVYLPQVKYVTNLSLCGIKLAS